MVKAASAGMITHLASSSRTLADCIQIIQKNGTIRTFTTLDIDLGVDIGDGNGTLTYKAGTGLTRSNVSESSGYSVDNLSLEGFVKTGTIEAADIRAGDYDFAEVRAFQVNFKNLSDGILRGVRGHLGEISIEDIRISLEVRSLKDLLNQNIVNLTSPDCRDDLGGLRCRVRLNPPAWAATTAYTVRVVNDANTGSVVKPDTFNDRHFKCTTAGTSAGSEPAWNLTIGGTTNDGSVVWTTIQALKIEGSVDVVTDNGEFTITASIDSPDALLTFGVLEWLTGNNAGRAKEVDSWVLSNKTVVLFLPMPEAVVNGDTFTIQAGCDKFGSTCTNIFDNKLNFIGEEFLPGNKVFIPLPPPTV